VSADAGPSDASRVDAGRRDAGGGTDAGPPSDLGTCDMPRMLAGTIGTVMIDGDTGPGPVGRDLGPDCGNPEAARFAPTDVIAYTVPGTGAIALDFTMVNTVTDMMYDSVIQIRRDCAMIPQEIIRTCFDDANPGEGEFRSAGTTTAEGGSTLFFLVSGYAETPVEGFTDRGAYRLEVTARQNNLPVVVGGTWNVIGPRVQGTVMGMDADMEPFAFAVTFQDDAGAAVDLNADGMVDANDDIAFVWDNIDEIDGMAAYTGVSSITGVSMAVPELGTRLTELMVTQASTRLIDGSFGIGPAMTLPVTTANEVGLGEACDAMNVCVMPLVCSATMVCEAPPAIATACMGATAITVATPTTTTTSSTVQTGMLTMDPGLFDGVCTEKPMTDTTADEALYTVTIPASPAVDLIATTDVAESMDSDTVLYVRSVCPVPTTEVACDDDTDPGAMMFRSRVEVLDIDPGTYTLFVESFMPDAPVPYGLQVSLRPVLPTGAACDPAGVMNRCAMGACPASMMCP
jgi:hypothetical protein